MIKQDPAAFNANLIKAFLYTMALVLLLLALIALLRYLHSKLKRKEAELLPESIGVPVGSPVRTNRSDRPVSREPANDPLAQIVRDYRRFSTAMKSDKARRSPSDTPKEFETKLRELAVMPRTAIQDITAGFTEARYAGEALDWDMAAAFSRQIDEALRKSSDSESSPNPGA